MKYDLLSGPRITKMTIVLEVNLDEDKQICTLYSLRYRTEGKAKAEELMLIFITKSFKNLKLNNFRRLSWRFNWLLRVEPKHLDHTMDYLLQHLSSDRWRMSTSFYTRQPSPVHHLSRKSENLDTQPRSTWPPHPRVLHPNASRCGEFREI